MPGKVNSMILWSDLLGLLKKGSPMSEAFLDAFF
jgi:hypothetical protein